MIAHTHLLLGPVDLDGLLGAVVLIPAAILQGIVEPIHCCRSGEVDQCVAEVDLLPAHHTHHQLNYHITISKGLV